MNFAAANLRTKMDFTGFDSSRILTLTGGIPRPMGDFPEGFSQRILAGMISVGRLGVRAHMHTQRGGEYCC